jgi:hypothetical protein
MQDLHNKITLGRKTPSTTVSNRVTALQYQACTGNLFVKKSVAIHAWDPAALAQFHKRWLYSGHACPYLEKSKEMLADQTSNF